MSSRNDEFAFAKATAKLMDDPALRREWEYLAVSE